MHKINKTANKRSLLSHTSFPTIKYILEIIDRTKTPKMAKSFIKAPIDLPFGPFQTYPTEYMIRPMKIVNPKAAAGIGK